MTHHATPSLVELTLTEQIARNESALAAIRSRTADITELQRLIEALSARGLNVRPAVTTHQVGAQAVCRLQVWLSCTLHELGRALDWLTAADISVTRITERDLRSTRTYELALRGQTMTLHAMVYDGVAAAGYGQPHEPAVA